MKGLYHVSYTHFWGPGIRTSLLVNKQVKLLEDAAIYARERQGIGKKKHVLTERTNLMSCFSH